MKFIFVAGFLVLLPYAMLAQSITGAWVAENGDGFTPRAAFGSCVANGNIYTLGGYDGTNFLNTLEIYDPQTNTWSTPQTTGTFTPRRGLSACFYNGKIYTFGGYNDSGTLNTLEVFDPDSNTWTTPVTTGTFTPRWRSTASLIGNSIYVIGGYSATLGAMGTIEVFHPDSNTWTTPDTVGTFDARSDHTASVVNGFIYIAGGDGNAGFVPLQVFDPETNTWSTPQTMGTFIPRKGLAAAVYDNKIFTFGGKDSVYFDNVVNVFDPSTNTWITPVTAGTFTPRAGLAAGQYNGTIYAIGGTVPTGYTAANEALTPAFDDVSSVKNDGAITLAPNPAFGTVRVGNVPATVTNITIANVLGQTMIEIPNPGSSSVPIDISTFPAGVYYIRIESALGTTAKTLVVE